MSPQKRLIASLFGNQKAFVLDESKNQAALCTRRAGKTHGAGGKLYLSGHFYPGSTALYLALTRDSARRLLWPKIAEMNHLFSLGLRMSESTLEARMPNGSKIMLFGADQENVARRLLGDAYSCVVIDEAQAFGSHLEELIFDILEPATLDYDGPICLTGTPGPACTGLFWEVTTGQKPGWAVHRWSLFDNPHLPHARAWVEDLKVRRNWTDDTPTLRREYFGEWVEDPNALVYRYRDSRNMCGRDARPPGLRFVMGVDLGYHDHFAIVVLGYSQAIGRAWVAHAESCPGLIPSQWAEAIQAAMRAWSPHSIVVDTGGLGRAIVEEFRQRYGIPAEPAEKTEKASYIELLNGDFEEGVIQVPEHLVGLRDQLKTLIWDDHGKEHPGMRNDMTDALLYAYKNSRHFWRIIENGKPRPGTSEWFEREEREMLTTLENRHRRRNREIC